MFGRLYQEKVQELWSGPLAKPGALASPVFQACQDPTVLNAGAISSALQASHLVCLQSAPRS